jgi:hypothetical protein
MPTEVIFNPGGIRKRKRSFPSFPSVGSNAKRRKGSLPFMANAGRRKGGRGGRRRRKSGSGSNPKSYSFGYNARSALAGLTSAAPASTEGVKGLLAGYKPGTVMAALPYVAGVMGSGLVMRYGAPMLPAVFSRGAGKLALGLGVAGGVAAVTNFVSRSWSRGVLLGGVGAVLLQAIAMFDPRKPMFGFGLSGLGSPSANWAATSADSPGLAGAGGLGSSSAAGALVADSGGSGMAGAAGFQEADVGDMIDEEESEF